MSIADVEVSFAEMKVPIADVKVSIADVKVSIAEVKVSIVDMKVSDDTIDEGVEIVDQLDGIKRTNLPRERLDCRSSQKVLRASTLRRRQEEL